MQSRLQRSGASVGVQGTHALLCCAGWLQGTLLFCVLLLAIWAPLLLFSSGAPTYTTPGILGARANASFGVVTSYGHYQGGFAASWGFRVRC